MQDSPQIHTIEVMCHQMIELACIVEEAVADEADTQDERVEDGIPCNKGNIS